MGIICKQYIKIIFGRKIINRIQLQILAKKNIKRFQKNTIKKYKFDK